MIKFEDNVRNIKLTFRKYLLGENNEENRKAFKELGYNDSNIKSYTTLNQTTLPSADAFPAICNIFGITLNELFGIPLDDVDNALKLYNLYSKSPNKNSIDILLKSENK